MEKNVIITTSSFAKFDQSPLKSLKQRFDQVALNPYARKLSENEVLALIREHRPVGMIAGVEPLTERVLKEAPQLKVISRAGVGMDSVDLDAAKALHITVANTPDAPTIPVAELTVGMMLCLLRKIHRSDQGIREGVWERPMGGLLYGKTVGLIGCGRIGQAVAHIVSAFACKVLGCDPVCCEHDKISFTELEHVLSASDIVSLHLPYSDQTHHLINADSIALMKKDAYLINAARGGLVDEAALYDALKDKRIAGAGLDSFETEPYNGSLCKLDNILLTGHIGSYAREGRIYMEKQAVDNLLRELKGTNLG